MNTINERDIVAEAEIRAAFGEPEGCKIIYTFEENRHIHTIRPQDGQEWLNIVNIKDMCIFQRYNLVFESCIFKTEISFIRATFNTILRFKKCIFNHHVLSYEATFYSISFEKECVFRDFVNFDFSIFNGELCCVDATFEGVVCFGSNFNQNVRFSTCCFKKAVFFSESTFKQNVFFEETTFEKGVHFGDLLLKGTFNSIGKMEEDS